jgi:hypothetical protein
MFYLPRDTVRKRSRKTRRKKSPRMILKRNYYIIYRGGYIFHMAVFDKTRGLGAGV